MGEPIQIQLTKPFQLGPWWVEPDSYRLLRDNTEVRLEPKVMQVLLCLAQMQGNVVSREQLEATVWAGTVVGYDAIAGSIIKLRKALGDDSRDPQYVETISKKGYRLLIDISQPQDSAHAPGEAAFRQPAATHVRTARSRTPFYISGLLLLTIILLAFWFYLDVNKDQLHQAATLPSIVVLPFRNLGNDESQDYLSEALTDDLITDLSRMQSLRVIAKQSAYHYLQRKNYSLHDVASELGVQYIVQGTVLKTQDRIRLNVQITDVNKGENIWGERFDVPQQQIFSMQDDITQHVFKALSLKPTKTEISNLTSRTTLNFAAYDQFLQGQQYFKNRSKQGFELAMQAYKKTIELDPKFARAYGAMAVALIRGNRGQWTRLSNEEAKSRALELVKTAESLNQASPEVYWALGFVHLYRHEFEKAEAAARNAVSLSPNYADGYGLLAFISNWRGKFSQAENYIRKAINLNPYYTFDYPWNLGLSLYYQQQYDKAVTQLQAALERNPTVLYPRIFLTASYVRLGRLDDASWEIEQITADRKEATLADMSSQLPFEHREHLEKVLTDLRTAGLPEK